MEIFFSLFGIIICILPIFASIAGLIFSLGGIFLVPNKTEKTKKKNTITLDKQKEVN